MHWAATTTPSKQTHKYKYGRPIGKKSLGRPTFRWEDNIRMDIKELVINTRNWVDSAQD